MGGSGGNATKINEQVFCMYVIWHSNCPAGGYSASLPIPNLGVSYPVPAQAQKSSVNGSHLGA